MNVEKVITNINGVEIFKVIIISSGTTAAPQRTYCNGLGGVTSFCFWERLEAVNQNWLGKVKLWFLRELKVANGNGFLESQDFAFEEIRDSQ